MSQISLEEPRQLIIELVPKFKSVSDVNSILKINNKIKEIHQSRQKILDASKENVQGKSIDHGDFFLYSSSLPPHSFVLFCMCLVWTRKVELMKLESMRPSHLTEEKHAEKMLTLDREKFILAKNMRDTENTIE